MTYRPTLALVDLGAIRHNVRAMKPPGSQVMAVVKADGYGHGEVEVAAAALQAGAAWLGVALVEEGIRLRQAGLEAPILVLSEFPKGAERDALAARLTPSVYTDEGLEHLAHAAGAVKGSVGVHVKVDTGMHRVGLPADRALGFARAVVAAGLDLDGLWTHFARSEEPEDPFTAGQLDRYLRVLSTLERAGLPPRYRHAANSGAVLTCPGAHLDLVRVGIAMYGLLPGPKLRGRVDLRPAMSWVSAVSMVKRLEAGERLSYGLRYRLRGESTVATVPVGYADGFSRLLSNRAEAIVRGRRYPVAGTVSMDQFLLDCGDDPVEAGDEVVMMGQQGNTKVSADDLAGWMGTINYEVVCGVSARVPRKYVNR